MKLGNSCEVQFKDEWNQADKHIDIVIHLRGLYRYTPKPYNRNILWIINHPERQTIEQINQFDLVFCAHASILKDWGTRQKCHVFIYLRQQTRRFSILPQAAWPKILTFCSSETGTIKTGGEKLSRMFLIRAKIRSLRHRSRLARFPRQRILQSRICGMAQTAAVILSCEDRIKRPSRNNEPIWLRE